MRNVKRLVKVLNEKDFVGSLNEQVRRDIVYMITGVYKGISLAEAINIADNLDVKLKVSIKVKK